MRRLRLGGVPLAVLAALAGACSGDLGMPAGATRQSQSVLELWRIVVFAGAGVGLVVYALLAWVIIRYRRRGDEALPQQTREHRVLEITYTAIPILIVAGLFLVAVPRNREILTVSNSADLAVQVEAFDWSWRFTYPATRRADGQPVNVVGTPDAPPVIELPVGATVHFDIRSGDVAHSFYLPDFLYKLDAIPGRENQFEVALTTVGTFSGQCAEFCGLDHARMRFTVEVVEGPEFDRWLAARQAEGSRDSGPEPPPTTGPPGQMTITTTPPEGTK